MVHDLKPADGAAFCDPEWTALCNGDPQYATWRPYNNDLCGDPSNPAQIASCNPCNPAKYPPGLPLPDFCGGAGVCWTGPGCVPQQNTRFQGGRWIMHKGKYPGNPGIPPSELVIDRVDMLSTNLRTGQKVRMAAKASVDSSNPAGSVCPAPPGVAGSTALTCDVIQYLIKGTTRVCPDGTTNCKKGVTDLPIFDKFGDPEQLMRGVPVNTGKAEIEHVRTRNPSFWYHVCCTGLSGAPGDVIAEDGWYTLRKPNDLTGSSCAVIDFRPGGWQQADWPDAGDQPVSCQPIN